MSARHFDRESLRAAGGRVARSVARSAGFELIRQGDTASFQAAGYDVVPHGRYDIVRRDYYSPVPDLSALPEDVWERRSAIGGVELNAAAGIEFVESRLASFVSELQVPLDGPREPGDFFLRNGNFESVDAELLYGVIRATAPRRVIELGSGYSTLLINLACRANARDGVEAVHEAFDPYPREQIVGTSLPDPTRLTPISATDVPPGRFEELQPGDVLFVDSTHTVKLGSDVNFVILDVLPRLRPGVVVHFHDIFLPWEYPRTWFTEMQYYWAEQYLLQAFLAFNADFEVLIPAQAVAREYPERLRRVIPSFAEGASPGSMWLRRTSGRSARTAV